MNRLDGEIALLSGAARGIGAETARLMVEAGARVVIGDILDEPGRETAREIGGGASAAIFHHLDVTSDADWNAAIGAAAARWGGLAGLYPSWLPQALAPVSPASGPRPLLPRPKNPSPALNPHLPG